MSDHPTADELRSAAVDLGKLTGTDPELCELRSQVVTVAILLGQKVKRITALEAELAEAREEIAIQQRVIREVREDTTEADLREQLATAEKELARLRELLRETKEATLLIQDTCKKSLDLLAWKEQQAAEEGRDE